MIVRQAGLVSRTEEERPDGVGLKSMDGDRYQRNHPSDQWEIMGAALLRDVDQG